MKLRNDKALEDDMTGATKFVKRSRSLLPDSRKVKESFLNLFSSNMISIIFADEYIMI